MSANKHSSNSKKHNKPRPPQISHSHQDTHENKEEKTNAVQEQQKNYACSTPHEVTINIPDKKDKMTIGNIIAFITCIATVAYFFATVSILHETKKTAAIADSTFRETRNEFSIGNEPFLQITNPFIPKFEIGDTLQINFSIENLGKYPVKVDTFRFYFDMSPNPFSFRMIDTTVTFYKSIANTYLVNGKFDNYKIQLSNIVDKNSRKLVKMKAFKFYFLGYIKYTNEVTKDLKVYKFEFELNPFDKLDKRTIVNNNDTISVYKR
jgi:hypothetical protein